MGVFVCKIKDSFCAKDGCVIYSGLDLVNIGSVLFYHLKS